jgi:hypothetical protein
MSPVQHRGHRARAGYDQYWAAQATNLLITVLDRLAERERTSFVFVVARDRLTGELVEEAFELWKAPRRIRRFLQKHPRDRYDLFWSPMAFAKPKRVRSAALSVPFGWCRLRNWRQCRPRPSIVWSIGGSFEAIWLWRRFESPGGAEAISRALAKRFGGDIGSTYPVSLLRVPHTINHDGERRAPVEVVWFDDLSQRRPKVLSGKGSPLRRKPRPPVPLRHGRYTVAETYRESVSPQCYDLMLHRRERRDDGPRCVTRMVRALNKAGASLDEIAAVVWRSPYFINRYGQTREKLDAVLRVRLRAMERAA